MKINSLIPLAAALLLIVGHLAAQDAASKPKTEIEAFQAQHGTVIVKGFTELPEIRGTGGTLSIIVQEYVDSTSKRKTKGLAVSIESEERYSSSARSFVEFAEIDSLVKGLEYISKIDGTATALKNFEAHYRTKDDFDVTVFNSSGGGLRLAVSVGRIGSKTVFFELGAVNQLISQFKQAKDILAPL